jgi:hypothetical protein
MEGTNEIFAFGQIHSGLSTNRAIHLCDHRRGDLHELHSSKVRGGHESSDIANDTSTDRDEQCFPVGACSHQFSGYFFDGPQILRRLPVVKQVQLSLAGSRNASSRRPAHEAPHFRGG